MRMFLPIKGPGGRYLTPREKVALLVLGLTLVLCLLTLLAGKSAYLTGDARNPVFALVGLLGRQMGGGIVALYGLILVWSGLIYFKGERVADVAPLAGRSLAAFGVLVGVSGALGIAHLETAGSLGLVVGGALGNTLGDAVGFPLLLMLMMLGLHLAGQGAWSAWREPTPVPAAAAAAPTPHAAFGVGLASPPERRFAGDESLPDDGDPTSDERSLAVTQAMEEIERRQGVTIVDVEPVATERPSIGEEVESAPPPPPETDEAEVQRGLQTVNEALTPREEEPEAAPEEAYDSEHHGLVPVPATDDALEAEGEEQEDEEYEEDEADEEAAYEEDEAEEGEEDEGEYEEYEEEEAEAEAADEEEYGEDEYEDDAEEEDDEEEEATADEEEEETDEPEPAAEEVTTAQADGYQESVEESEGDPYAQGGLVRRVKENQPEPQTRETEKSPYTSFDWRGRPLD